ncbi:MAG: UvrD-helicase domain-containing protein [Anaerolineae bacterium]
MAGTSDPAFVHLSDLQQQVVSFPRDGGARLYVHGPAGTGKSTALIHRVTRLLQEGVRTYEMLVMVPRRAEGERYERALARLEAPSRGGIDLVTYNGFTRRAVALFWPLVARAAGFRHPEREPVFLTIESAQYHMLQVCEPLIADGGYFSDLTIRRGRLLSQLIDNLNKSALAGFDHTEIYPRLKGAWTGGPEHLASWAQAQECAVRFRRHCLERGLLDLSLVTEVFHRHLLRNDVFQRVFSNRYRHVVVDNVEENVPVAHDLIRFAAETCASMVLACDDGGGYRIFLGADAGGGQALQASCAETLHLNEPVAGEEIRCLADAICAGLHVAPYPEADCRPLLKRAISGQFRGRFWISMVRWVAARAAELVAQGVAPGEIGIVAPYVNEVMRFTLEEELKAQGLSMRLLRPSTALADDPTIRGLLALVRLAHPGWAITVQERVLVLHRDDVALGLETALEGLDPVRAHLLARATYQIDTCCLANLSELEQAAAGKRTASIWERVGFQVGERYEALRAWLERYAAGPALSLDVFLSELFADLLSRPGYGFVRHPSRARAYARLVESARKFRQSACGEGEPEGGWSVLSHDYTDLVLGGLASAEYLSDVPETEELPDEVVVAPAYAYLTRDMRSRYQFWIDLGSDGWWNRPNQPVTHPYVLSRQWPVGQPWRDIEEEQARREALGRVVRGLAARCTEGVYLASSELGIGGEEQGVRLERLIQTGLTRGARHE